MFLMLTLGCHHRIDFGKEGPLRDPHEVLARVQKSDARLVGLKGGGRLSIQSPSGKGNVSVFIATTRPASLYFEVQDFFGKPQASLSSNGTVFGAFQAAEGKFYTGPASPSNVSMLLPIALPAEDLVALFLGQVRRLDGEIVAMDVDERVGGYRIQVSSGAARQTLWVHPRFFRVMRSELSGVTLAYRVEVDEYVQYGSLTVPKRIVLEAEREKTRLELRYKDLELNVPIDAQHFDPSPPDGIPVVQVDALGNVVIP